MMKNKRQAFRRPLLNDYELLNSHLQMELVCIGDRIVLWAAGAHSLAWWFDGDGNDMIYSKVMNVVQRILSLWDKGNTVEEKKL